VLICEELNAALPEVQSGVTLDYRPNLWSRRAELLTEMASAAALVVRNRTRVDEELVDSAPHLRVLGRLGSGRDNIDTDALAHRHIELVDGAGLNAHAVAEYVVGAMLALARHLTLSDREVRAGTWCGRVGLELRGLTLGVVGLGPTGSEVCRLGQALGMRVVGLDSNAALHVPGVQAMTLEGLLRASAVVSLHVPLTSATRRLIGSHQLQLMPRGALLVNAARGGIVDEPALAEQLRLGHLGGAALDVRTQEPPPQPDALAALDQVLLTPHVAGWTSAAQSSIAAHVLGGVQAALCS